MLRFTINTPKTQDTHMINAFIARHCMYIARHIGGSVASPAFMVVFYYTALKFETLGWLPLRFWRFGKDEVEPTLQYSEVVGTKHLVEYAANTKFPFRLFEFGYGHSHTSDKLFVFGKDNSAIVEVKYS